MIWNPRRRADLARLVLRGHHQPKKHNVWLERVYGQRSLALGRRLNTNNVKDKVKTQTCVRECTTIVKERT